LKWKNRKKKKFKKNKLRFLFMYSFQRNLKTPLGLREIGRQGNSRWQELLDHAKCTIIGSSNNEHFDSYVLSESSLFVYPQKFLIKTCGTTTLLKVIPKLLEYAQELGMELEYVMYSRKNFLFPHVQVGPHVSWEKEVDFLNEYFDGSAYVMGPMTGDHWHLYLADCAPETQISPVDVEDSGKEESDCDHGHSGSESDDQIQEPRLRRLSHSVQNNNNSENESLPVVHLPGECTLEIMMHGLQRASAERFYKKPNTQDRDAMAGVLGNLVPAHSDTIIDEFNFTPCGYSMNAMHKNHYWTIHVTPEPHCSYASFETNLPLHENQNNGDSYSALLKRVTDFFMPASFTLSYFAEFPLPSEMPQFHLPGFSVKYKTTCDLEGRGKVVVANFESLSAKVSRQQKHSAAVASLAKKKNFPLISSLSVSGVMPVTSGFRQKEEIDVSQ
jgi:S-adenosylmethionine decarboxylase